MSMLIKDFYVDVERTFGEVFFIGTGNQKFNYEEINGQNVRTTPKANVINAVAMEGAVLAVEVPLEVDVSQFAKRDRLVFQGLAHRTRTRTVEQFGRKREEVEYVFTADFVEKAGGNSKAGQNKVEQAGK